MSLRSLYAALIAKVTGKPDPNPDTSRIKKNDIYEETLLKTGRSSAFDKTHPTIPQMLFKRQCGMQNQGKFIPSDRRVISKPFLPNSSTTLDNYRQKTFCGTYSVDGNIFLSASQDQCIRVYDTRDDEFKLLKKVRARDVGWSVLDTAFSPDGNYMAYSSWSDCIHLCNVYGDEEIHQALPLHPNANSFCIFSLTFSSDNREIMGGANDGNLYVYDRDSGQRSLKIETHEDDVNAVAFADRSSQILFSGGDDGLIKVWDRRTLKEGSPVPVGIMAGHYDGITFIDSKGDSRYLLSNSKDQTMKLWDVRNFSPQDAIEQTKRAVSKQRWDYRWQQVPKRMLKKPQLEGDGSVMTYRGHSVLHTLIRCRFSPEYSTGQRYVYTGCALGNLVVYDLLSGNVVRKLEGHRSCVRDVSWHPYENNIMTASWDGTVRKWTYEAKDEINDLRVDSPDDNGNSDDDDDDESRRRRRSLRHCHEKRLSKKQRTSSQCEYLMPEKCGGLFD
ncbi:DDB1- and CUL4-associated factor 11-like isoform X2 [Mya arenaria]|uniref:DDB1- and CUL4-associated factor 11-like isoform X2 n=1 Tax=Mya arenaria TaxID=6604 RepID=UPI0022E853E3|nr:DDB1- and CUL4-associated factor 11-like isoform X2 [Mya arenaria]